MGSGTSHGVPAIGCDCDVCRSTDPRDKRTRPSILIEIVPGPQDPAHLRGAFAGAVRSILVDTSTDLRTQALANDIKVVFPGAHKLNDAEIAAAVLDGLHRSVSVPKAGVDVTVSDGVITLRGGVEWRYQRQAAENAVRDAIRAGSDPHDLPARTQRVKMLGAVALNAARQNLALQE